MPLLSCGSMPSWYWENFVGCGARQCAAAGFDMSRRQVKPRARAPGPIISLPISQSALVTFCLACHWRNIEPNTSDMLSLRPPRLVRVGEAEAVLRHAVGELMANNVVALREIDEDVAVAVTVGHLAAVPECVVVLDAEVDRGSQPHPGVVDRVSAEQFFVKLGDTCRLHEGLLGCRIGRSFGFGHQGARQCSAVIAIENRDRGR